MKQPKRFAFTITASPLTGDQVSRALRFAHAIEHEQHHLCQIFFYGDGVLCARADSETRGAWEMIQQQQACSLYVCVSAAQRRGIDTLNPPWQLVGLGDWVEGMDTDHHLHFGD